MKVAIFDVDSKIPNLALMMPYNKTDKYQQNFSRWVNRRGIFKKIPWHEYDTGIRSKITDENQMALAL